MKDGLVGLYLVVWFVAGISSWLYLRSLDAEGKRRQTTRVQLAVLTAIGGLMALIPAVDGLFGVSFLIVAVLGFFLYVIITRHRLCMSCNRELQSQLLRPAEYCPRCGAKTVRFLRPFERERKGT